MKILKTSYLVIPLFILWLFSIGLFGCIQNIKTYDPLNYFGGENFKTFTDYTFYPFSFEYPNCYQVFVELSLTDTPIKQLQYPYPPCGNFSSVNYIGVFSNDYYRNAEIEMEKSIEKYQEMAKASANGNFKIMSKQTIAIIGEKGWEIEITLTLTNTAIQDLEYLELPTNPTEIKIRQLFFNHKDIIWSVLLLSDNITGKQPEVDYDHVVRTFKFLD